MLFDTSTKDQMALWPNPRVDVLILATSGRFTADAVTWIEQHNASGASPRIDMWAETIAVAAARNFLPVIDEKRGRARAFAKARAAGWSLDIFRHPAALATLGDQSAIDALYLALRDGRMRIPPESADSVIGIIGIERSRDCTCFPGYRDRFAGAPNRAIDVESTAAADLEVGE